MHFVPSFVSNCLLGISSSRSLCPFGRDVEAAISSTASASTPIASAPNRTWTRTEPGLYLIYELLTSITIKTSSLRFTRAHY